MNDQTQFLKVKNSLFVDGGSKSYNSCLSLVYRKVFYYYIVPYLSLSFLLFLTYTFTWVHKCVCIHTACIRAKLFSLFFFLSFISVKILTSLAINVLLYLLLHIQPQSQRSGHAVPCPRLDDQLYTAAAQHLSVSLLIKKNCRSPLAYVC